MTTLTLLIVLAIATPFVLFMFVLAWADIYSRGARSAADAADQAAKPAESDYRKAA
jgi:hypothetical protein